MHKGSYPLRGSDSASCIINGQTLIVQSKNKKLFVLNSAGTKIWELSDGRHEVNDIINKIRATSKKTELQIRKEIEEFIDELVERQVLEVLVYPCDVDVAA
ncbi:MAG TPA: PqqD family protein [Candidatus Aquicultor sp.]|jgi:hypothetical protein